MGRCLAGMPCASAHFARLMEHAREGPLSRILSGPSAAGPFWANAPPMPLLALMVCAAGGSNQIAIAARSTTGTVTWKTPAFASFYATEFLVLKSCEPGSKGLRRLVGSLD